jgi:hypothetical protein
MPLEPNNADHLLTGDNYYISLQLAASLTDSWWPHAEQPPAIGNRRGEP